MTKRVKVVIPIPGDTILLEVTRPKGTKDKTVHVGMRLFSFPGTGIVEARHRAPAKPREFALVGHVLEVTEEKKVCMRVEI